MQKLHTSATVFGQSACGGPIAGCRSMTDFCLCTGRWEVLVLARKCLIVVVQTLVPSSLDNALSFVLLLFIAGGALCLHYNYLPYRDHLMDRTAAVSLVVNAATLLLSVYVTYAQRPFCNILV